MQMADEPWAGHHCKVCHEQWLKKQREKEIEQVRKDQYVVRPVKPQAPKPQPEPAPAPVIKIKGCIFAKSCLLPDAITDYRDPNGFVPTESLRRYGNHAFLGGRTVNSAGVLPLENIGGDTLPTGLGRLSLAGVVTAPVAAGMLTGLAALLWSSSLGDSALYSEEQLRALNRARTRVRINVEQQADGRLKGYAFYTGNNREWEEVDVVRFQPRGAEQVAELGGGIELIWTPSVDPADTLGIPALEASPQAPHIWVFPATPQADNIIVNPIYPPEYKDFILVFPVGAGVAPLYIVLSLNGLGYHPKPEFLPAFPDATKVKPKGSVKGGGSLRPRWRA
ncbi:hypothetical protein PS3A_32500 [Pseudomonas sp. 3A(2025)]